MDPPHSLRRNSDTMLPDDIKNLNLWPKYRLLIKDHFHLDRRIRRCHVQKNICNDETSPCPRLVLLYARMGLHPYNFLEKKKFQLSRVKEYNMSTGSAAASYEITLEAMDLGLQTFETHVSESSFGKFVLTCQIARPLGETIDVGKGTDWVRNDFLEDSIPGWPSENPFENSNRCHVLNGSELQDKDNDWIRLYLELAVATTNRGTIRTHDLSSLKIVKVAIDYTPQDVDLEFNRKHVAIVYIRYKDSCEARVGKDVDRVAIVRRAFTEQLVNFTLVGQTLSLESIPEKGKKQRQQLPVSLSLKRRLLSSPKRLLSSPKRLKAYKYSRVGLSRRLDKARSTFE